MGENDLIAIISSSVHDMKAPLTTISGFAGAMLDGTIPEEKREHYLAIIRDESERMSRICEELLEASRIEAGCENYKNETVDISDIARNVIVSLLDEIEAKNLNFEFNEPEIRQTVMGDKGAITRLLYNICENAVKFSYKGGDMVVTLGVIDGYNAVRIENSGDAISDEVKEKIFLPFYRSGKGSGSGLGMFIAKRIADAHGAEIKIDRDNDRTVFTVVFGRG
ncbi:MAG: HAMP domain-containing histidine kinase [Clostridia bacterium]|nr:HAMP domain-containing histidine kinase [Clostridia bacterium]